MSIFIVRPMTSDDSARYKSIRLRALADSPEAFAGTFEAEQRHKDAIWSKRLEMAVASEADLPLFATFDDIPVGLVWAKANKADPRVISIFQMWVNPTYRGQGVGRKLLETVLAWSRARGASEVLLGVMNADTPAMQLYLSVGFEAIGQLEPLREGSSLQSRNMRLIL